MIIGYCTSPVYGEGAYIKIGDSYSYLGEDAAQKVFDILLKQNVDSLMELYNDPDMVAPVEKYTMPCKSFSSGWKSTLFLKLQSFWTVMNIKLVRQITISNQMLMKSLLV